MFVNIDGHVTLTRASQAHDADDVSAVRAKVLQLRARMARAHHVIVISNNSAHAHTSQLRLTLSDVMTWALCGGTLVRLLWVVLEGTTSQGFVVVVTVSWSGSQHDD